MNALSYWKLTRNPFAPDSSVFFVGGSVEEAVARADFLVESRRSLGLLIGPEGVGKTAFLQRCCKQSYRIEGLRRVQSVYTSARGLSGREVLDGFVASLSTGSRNQPVRQEPRRNFDAWTTLSDLFVAFRAMESHLVWFVDDIAEASSVAEPLRRLVELDGPLTILMSTSTELATSLPTLLTNLNELRIDLPSWELGLTADYFDATIEQAGGDPAIFEAQAITRLHELGDGLPARIKRLADLALFAGASRREARISSEVVEEIFEEFAMIGSPQDSELLSRERV